ncbi:hypothetical protein K474DRAFT_1711889, partial [Panus rudis PR-1116 ss-1]
MSTCTNVPSSPNVSSTPNVSPTPNVLPTANVPSSLDTASPSTMTPVEPSVEQTTPEPAPAAEASPQNTPDVLSNPQSVRRRCRPPPLLPAERPEPTHAFGFIIPEECAEGYAKEIVASCSDYAPGTEDYDYAVRCMTNHALTKLPAHIHAKIPTLPTPHALPL